MVVSLFCGHSSWNKINFVSRGHLPASKPKAVQEKKKQNKKPTNQPNKAKTEKNQAVL